MARKISIATKRVKGPPTPNFGKVSHLLEIDATTTVKFDKETVRDQHGGIGIKMAFVCDLLEVIESLAKHEKKAFSEGSTLFINSDVFFGLILNLDVFLFELYSILDYLAVELTEIFGLKVKRRDGRLRGVEYFTELKDAANMNLAIKKMVDTLTCEPWFKYFHRLRNRVTHRMLVDLPGLATYEKDKIIKFDYPFLPDNPDKVTLTFDLRRSLADEPKTWMNGVFGFVDNVCGVLLSTLFKSPTPMRANRLL